MSSGGRRDGLPPKPKTSEAALRLDVRALVARLDAPKPTGPEDYLHFRGEFGELLGCELLLQHDGGAMAVEHRARDFTDRFELVTLEPRVGRRRQWLAKCPGCARRAAVLYGSATVAFRCAECGPFAYTSSASSKFSRFGAKGSDLANRLAIDPTFSAEPLARPFGMRRATYRRLVAELRAARAREVEHARQSIGGLIAAFYKLGTDRGDT